MSFRPDDGQSHMTTQVIASGHGLVESARFHNGEFWFADWFTQTIHRVDATGAAHVVAQASGMPICFDWLPDGTLVQIGGDGELSLLTDVGTLESYVNLGDLSDKPYNDIAVAEGGNIFVNNIGFTFPGGEFAPGFVAVIGPDAVARRVADDLAFPNGMALVDDGATLVVAESYAARLTAFTVGTDGSLTDRRVWADLGEGVAPDGISADPSGAIWYASVPQQHCALVAEGGEVRATVPLDRGCFDCAVTDDGATLYVASAGWGDEIAGSGQLLAFDLSRAG